MIRFTVLPPSVRRKRAEAVEAALDRPASEQIDPSRPERARERPVVVRDGEGAVAASSDGADHALVADDDADV